MAKLYAAICAQPEDHERDSDSRTDPTRQPKQRGQMIAGHGRHMTQKEA